MKARTALLAVLSTACSVDSAQDTPPAPCRAPARAGCPPRGEPTVDPVVPLGRANTSTFIEITDIEAHDTLAYVCTGVRGLSIFDTRDNAPVRLVEDVAPRDGLSHGTFPRCQHVGLDAQRGRVVITNRGDEVQPTPWLAIFDVADPRRPQRLGVWEADASVEGVAISGDRVFAALHTRGVVALRLGSDGTVHEEGRAREANTDAWQPVLVGDTLVVAEGEAGVRLYDVTAETPALLATAEVFGSSRDVLVEGERAYVASSSGIAVLDISDPSAPTVLAEHPVGGSPLDLALVGPAQIAVAEWDALRGYDLTDATVLAPLFTETVPTQESTSRVLAVGTERDRGRLYGGEWTGLHAFSFEPTAAPELELSPRALQFGDVRPSDPDTRVLVVANQGTTPLTVHDVTGSSSISVDETCFVVEPGRSTAVEVQLDPTTSAPLRSAVRVCSDDPDEPDVEVPLTANIEGRSVGDPAPSFALRDLQGNTWSNADLDGKVAVLAYFATF